jgi:hypothetical protein
MNRLLVYFNNKHLVVQFPSTQVPHFFNLQKFNHEKSLQHSSIRSSLLRYSFSICIFRQSREVLKSNKTTWIEERDEGAPKRSKEPKDGKKKTKEPKDGKKKAKTPKKGKSMSTPTLYNYATCTTIGTPGDCPSGYMCIEDYYHSINLCVGLCATDADCTALGLSGTTCFVPPGPGGGYVSS